MSLNHDQKHHLATTFRIIGIAFFGYFGYHGLKDFSEQWFLVLWSASVFLLTEFSAIIILED